MQLTRDLFAIAKFLFLFFEVRMNQISVVFRYFCGIAVYRSPGAQLSDVVRCGPMCSDAVRYGN